MSGHWLINLNLAILVNRKLNQSNGLDIGQGIK